MMWIPKMLGLVSVLVQSLLVRGAAVCSVPADLGKSFRNACDEWCKCIQLPSSDMAFECYRERKEITCMTETERLRFLNAYVLISSPGHILKPSFDSLINKHTLATFGTIHTPQFFLPWHRWFILELENLLREVDCRITVPWWDWTKRTTTWQTNSPFLVSPSWHGGNGSPTCVSTGPFASPGWATTASACLHRNFNGNMPAYPLLATVLGVGSGAYTTFSSQLEGIHNTPHVRIAGTMVTAESPQAPEFFLHHGMIDRMWGEWQKLSASHLASYAFALDTPMPYAMGTTPRQVRDLSDQKGCIKVRYVRESSRVTGEPLLVLARCNLIRIGAVGWLSVDWLHRGLAKLDVTALQTIPQLKTEPLTDMETKKLIKWCRAGDNNNDVERDHAEAMRIRLEEFNKTASQYYAYANVVSPEDLRKLDPSSYEAGYDIEEAWRKIKGNSETCKLLEYEDMNLWREDEKDGTSIATTPPRGNGIRNSVEQPPDKIEESSGQSLG
eukprot:gb/GEZN01003938.1/.p1 GENE.gb/GEZN01003938.1/~~gb/GEZN01003938.1/.p1  ORF type:complete len:499 (-),score=46.36 gb/GEZN01003938.1/:518-2014(-)